MPFHYAIAPITRKQDPSGYINYASYKPWLRDEFAFRCVYCLDRERWYPNGHASFGVDHVLPQGNPEYEHLTCCYSNLVYACNRCNSSKKDKILINPDSDGFGLHLRVNEEGEIFGITTAGRDLVNILGLNLLGSTNARKAKNKILSLYLSWPENPEVRHLYFDAFGYPQDLPDLKAHSKAKNSNLGGVLECYYQRRAHGILPSVYL